MNCMIYDGISLCNEHEQITLLDQIIFAILTFATRLHFNSSKKGFSFKRYVFLVKMTKGIAVVVLICVPYNRIASARGISICIT